jgi:hypothetical protein
MSNHDGHTTNPLTLIRRAMAKCAMAYDDAQVEETKERAKLVLIQAKYNIEDAIKALETATAVTQPENVGEADTQPPSR